MADLRISSAPAWRVLLMPIDQRGAPLKLCVEARSAAELEAALLRRAGLPPSALPLQWLDDEFRAWCELSQSAFEDGLPTLLRVRASPRTDLSPRTQANFDASWADVTPKGELSPLALPHRSSLSDAAAAATVRAAKERSFSGTAIFLEDRLKTVGMAIVSTVLLGFVLW